MKNSSAISTSSGILKPANASALSNKLVAKVNSGIKTNVDVNSPKSVSPNFPPAPDLNGTQLTVNAQSPVKRFNNVTPNASLMSGLVPVSVNRSLLAKPALSGTLSHVPAQRWTNVLSKSKYASPLQSTKMKISGIKLIANVSTLAIPSARLKPSAHLTNTGKSNSAAARK